MTIEERLDNLERELSRAKRRNRWQLIGFGLCFAIIIIGDVFVMSVRRFTLKEVHANKFVLEDANGKMRAGLYLAKDGPVLNLLDEKGAVRAKLFATEDGAQLYMADKNAKMSAILLVNNSGSWLALNDEHDKPRVVLDVMAEGASGLKLNAENSKSSAWLSVWEDTPRLYLSDKNGNRIPIR